EKKILGDIQSVELILKPNEMRIIDWFYKNSGQIEQKSNDDGSITIKAMLTAEARKRLNYIKQNMY
ncbi:MAG: GTPase HflX, partial [Bartonella sp.]|nr:GTPase HflX [Bartonella sp.]